MEFISIPIRELFSYESLEHVALVTDPAIEEYFVALSKEHVQLKVTNEEKRIVCGPALIPNKKIFRIDEETGEPHYIIFSEDTVRRISEDFLKDRKTHSFNLQHEEDTSDLYITESWIIEDPETDKSRALGMYLPKGTWMLSAKVPNDEIWERVKSGELRGFSIAGKFNDKKQNEAKEYESQLSIIIDILNSVE